MLVIVDDMKNMFLQVTRASVFSMASFSNNNILLQGQMDFTIKQHLTYANLYSNGYLTISVELVL